MLDDPSSSPICHRCGKPCDNYNLTLCYECRGTATKGGDQAKVEYIMPEPNGTAYPLKGWVKDVTGIYHEESWNTDGIAWHTNDHNLVQYLWRIIRRFDSSGWYSCLADANKYSGELPRKGIIGVLRATKSKSCNEPDFNQPIVWMTLEEAEKCIDK